MFDVRGWWRGKTPEYCTRDFPEARARHSCPCMLASLTAAPTVSPALARMR